MMQQRYSSGSSPQVTAGGGILLPTDLTFHTKNAEEWNDFNESSGVRDQGRREHSHREFGGNRKHEKLTEERHVAGPSTRADQWQRHEYFQSNLPNEKTRILRNERAVNEHKEDVSPNGVTTRKIYSHSSSVHVSTHTTAQNNSLKLGDARMDGSPFENSQPLDHSPQKGKGSLGKQGALNQRRRPSKGCLKINSSPDDDRNVYYDHVPFSTAREELPPEVQRQNVENTLRSHRSTLHETSHINSTATKNVKSPSIGNPERPPEWLKELKERKLKKTHETTAHPTPGTRAEEQQTNQVSSAYRKSTTKDTNNTVLVVNSGTWTKDKRQVRSSRGPETPPTRHATKTVSKSPGHTEGHLSALDPKETHVTYHRVADEGNGDSQLKEIHRSSVNTTRTSRVTLTTEGRGSYQGKEVVHQGERNTRKNTTHPTEKAHTAPSPQRKAQTNPVTFVEGPTTKLVTTFNYQSKTSARNISPPEIQQFGTYEKKKTSQSPYSGGEITINGSHPASTKMDRYSPPPRNAAYPSESTNYTSSKREVSSRQMIVTRAQDSSPQTQVRKLKIDGVNDHNNNNNNRAIMMNEIRKFDQRNLRKQSKSTKVGTTTSWLEGRYASCGSSSSHSSSSHFNTAEEPSSRPIAAPSTKETKTVEREIATAASKGRNYSTKILLSPDQKMPDGYRPEKSARKSPEREHRSSNPTRVQRTPYQEVRSFERTQSLPDMGIAVKSKTERTEERWDTYEDHYDDELEEEEDLDARLFYESDEDENEEGCWVVRRNIDWENLERRNPSQTGRASPPWKNQVRLQATPSSLVEACYSQNEECFDGEHQRLRCTPSPVNSSDTLHHSLDFPEVNLRKTPTSNKVPPTSFTFSEVELRKAPSIPGFEPEHFTLSHVELHRTPSLPRLETESFCLPEVYLRPTTPVRRDDSDSFTVPHVQLRRTPSLPRLEPDSFQLPQVSLRRTPSLPRLEPDSFQLPQVALRRTPSLPRLEPEGFHLPDVYLRRTPSVPRLDPESLAFPSVHLQRTPSMSRLEPETLTLPDVELRKMPSYPKREPEHFRIPNVSLRRTPSIPRLDSDPYSFPEVQLRRTPSLPRLESESFWIPSIELRHTPLYSRREPESFRLPAVTLHSVPFPPQSPTIDRFTLPPVELHQTNLWVSKDVDEDDHYGYSQSELTFDEERDSSGWSPRVLSPFVHRGSSPQRAISPVIQPSYSEPNLQPTWVQLANEKQQKSYDWETVDQRSKPKGSPTDVLPWQEESIRKSESIRHLMLDTTNEGINNGIMSLDRRFGKTASQESVSSWEWMEPRDGGKPLPEWVEIAKQRQRLRYELQESEGDQPSPSKRPAPTWRNEVKLRATPGVPTRSERETTSPDHEDATEIPVKIPYKASPHKIEMKTGFRPLPVRAELLQNVQLKKTSHLTQVKGPQVGRVVNAPQKSRSHPIGGAIRAAAGEREGHQSPGPRTPHKSNTEHEITVDHVLSSIRLIREASLSTSDLLDLKKRVTVSPLSPAGRPDDDLNTPHRALRIPSPRSTSPLNSSKDGGGPSDDASMEGFYRTPQWILDLKAQKQQRRSQPMRPRAEQTRQELHVDVTVPWHESRSPGRSPEMTEKPVDYSEGTALFHPDKSAPSSRRQFRNVLQEIKNVSRDDLLVSVQESQNYGSLKHRSDEERTVSPITNIHQDMEAAYRYFHSERVYRTETFDNQSQRISHSPTKSPESTKVPETEKENDGVSYEPLTWWIQVQPKNDGGDSFKRQIKLEGLLSKKSVRTSGQSPTQPKQSSPTPPKRSPASPKKKSSPPNAEKRLPVLSKNRSPPSSTSSISARSTEPNKKSGIADSTRTTPVRRRSSSTSPTRPSPQSFRGSVSTKSPRSPTTTPSPTRSPTNTTPKGRSQAQSARGTPSPKSVRSPKSTSPRSTTKSPVPADRDPSRRNISTVAKTEITIGTQAAGGGGGAESRTIRSSSPSVNSTPTVVGRKPFTPSKSTTSPAALAMSSRTAVHQVKQSSSLTINVTQSSVKSGKSSPKPDYSAPSPVSPSSPKRASSPEASSSEEHKGRFSQLLLDLSKTNLQRSQSLKSDGSRSPFLDDEKGTYPIRVHGSDFNLLDSWSSRSLNLRKPRVRFSSTEIVWPLDLEGHSPVTTCHHPVHSNK